MFWHFDLNILEAYLFTLLQFAVFNADIIQIVNMFQVESFLYQYTTTKDLLIPPPSVSVLIDQLAIGFMHYCVEIIQLKLITFCS